MKTYLVVTGILLSLLNGLLLVPAASTYTAPIAAIALVLSLLILTLSLLGGPKGRTTPGPVPAAGPASPLSQSRHSPKPRTKRKRRSWLSSRSFRRRVALSIFLWRISLLTTTRMSEPLHG